MVTHNENVLRTQQQTDLYIPWNKVLQFDPKTGAAEHICTLHVRAQITNAKDQAKFVASLSLCRSSWPEVGPSMWRRHPPVLRYIKSRAASTGMITQTFLDLGPEKGHCLLCNPTVEGGSGRCRYAALHRSSCLYLRWCDRIPPSILVPITVGALMVKLILPLPWGREKIWMLSYRIKIWVQWHL